MKPMGKPEIVKAVKPRDRNDLYHVADGYDFIYETSRHTKVEVCRPGFFNIYRDELRAGMMVECRLGQVADGITQVFVQVIEAPKHVRMGDVVVSIGPSKKFTPARHDGMLAENEEKSV